MKQISKTKHKQLQRAKKRDQSICIKGSLPHALNASQRNPVLESPFLVALPPYTPLGKEVTKPTLSKHGSRLHKNKTLCFPR